MLFRHTATTLSALVAFGVSLPRAQATDADYTGARKIPNLVYADPGGHKLKLDIYLPLKPAQSAAGYPVVIYIHGGGWIVGNRKEVRPYIQMLTDTGIAVVTISYRLSLTAPYPAQIQDCKTAVRWVRANSPKYGLDPGRIGAYGLSAGGHLAALLGTTAGVESLEGRDEGNPEQSSRVQAVCTVSSPIDLTLPTHKLIGKISRAGEMRSTPAENPALYRSANPALYVKGGEPPFFIVQGDADQLVLPENARVLEAALKKKGDQVTVDMVPGGKHIPITGKEKAAITKFFVKYLHPKS